MHHENMSTIQGTVLRYGNSPQEGVPSIEVETTREQLMNLPVNPLGKPCIVSIEVQAMNDALETVAAIEQFHHIEMWKCGAAWFVEIGGKEYFGLTLLIALKAAIAANLVN